MPLVLPSAPAPGVASSVYTPGVGIDTANFPLVSMGGTLIRPDYGRSIAGGMRLKRLIGLRGEGEMRQVLDEATRAGINQYIQDRLAEGYTRQGDTLTRDVGGGVTQIITIDWSTGQFLPTTKIGPSPQALAAQKKAERESGEALLRATFQMTGEGDSGYYLNKARILESEAAQLEAEGRSNLNKLTEAAKYRTLAAQAERKEYQAKINRGEIGLYSVGGMPMSMAPEIGQKLINTWAGTQSSSAAFPTGTGPTSELDRLLKQNLPKVDVSGAFNITTVTSKPSSKSSKSGGGSSGGARYDPVTGIGFSSSGQGYSSAFDLGSGGTGSRSSSSSNAAQNTLNRLGFGQTSSSNIFTSSTTTSKPASSSSSASGFGTSSFGTSKPVSSSSSTSGFGTSSFGTSKPVSSSSSSSKPSSSLGGSLGSALNKAVTSVSRFLGKK